jgi:hypothetical protein
LQAGAVPAFHVTAGKENIPLIFMNLSSPADVTA